MSPMTIVPTTISVVSFLSYQIQKWRRATNECIMVGQILTSLQNSLKFELWVSLQEGHIEVLPVRDNFETEELLNALKGLYDACELKQRKQFLTAFEPSVFADKSVSR